MTDHRPRREATRHRLVEAAIEEFAARGIDGTSVEQLCEAAGFTRGAFYSNFSSKDDICLAIIKYQRDRVFEALTTTFGQPPADADLDWIFHDALGRFLQIIAPDENHRRTLAELRQRTNRDSAFGARAAEIGGDVNQALTQAVDELASGLGIGFRVPTPLLIATMEAVYLQEASGPDHPGAESMIGPLVRALTVPLDQP
ncbi:MAG: TetR/AcrR family transcriptional regulator [Arachnia sp.]